MIDLRASPIRVHSYRAPDQSTAINQHWRGVTNIYLLSCCRAFLRVHVIVTHVFARIRRLCLDRLWASRSTPIRQLRADTHATPSSLRRVALSSLKRGIVESALKVESQKHLWAIFVAAVARAPSPVPVYPRGGDCWSKQFRPRG